MHASVCTAQGPADWGQAHRCESDRRRDDDDRGPGHSAWMIRATLRAVPYGRDLSAGVIKLEITIVYCS